MVSEASMNILFCGRRSDETLRKGHLVNASYLFLTSVRKSLRSIAVTRQHDTCPDWLAMGERIPSMFISM